MFCSLAVTDMEKMAIIISVSVTAFRLNLQIDYASAD